MNYGYTVELYDKDGFLKTVEKHESHLLAVRSGENWKMLTKGNYFKVAKLKLANT